jgi:cytochrome P450
MLCHVLKFFPFILKPVRWLPSQLTIFLGLENKSLRSLQDIIDKQIISKSSQTDLCEKNKNHTTENIFTSLCNPRVPAEERTLERLRDESLVLLIAGAEATARALAVFAYYAATGSICLDRLRKELREVLPDSKSHASWSQLEHLPYLVCWSLITFFWG